jgi:hypothetical protein
MTSNDRLARVEWLTDLGVPAAYHDAIIDSSSGWKSQASTVAVGIGAVAVVIGVTWAAFNGLDSLVHAKAIELAHQTGATLMYVNVGIGPLILLFGLIALMGWLSGALSRLRGAKGFPKSAAAGINRPPPHGYIRVGTRWLLAGSVRRAASRTTTVEAFLRTMTADMSRRWGIAAVVLLAPAIAMTVIETDHFWVAGPSGIVEHRLLPPFSSRTYDLASATALTTGCNHTDKGEYLHYDLDFASGASFNLGNAEGVAGRSAPALEQIDTKLDRAIQHRRWSHLDRDPVHPACLRFWGAQLGQFGQGRLVKMLRLTPEEQRRAF